MMKIVKIISALVLVFSVGNSQQSNNDNIFRLAQAFEQQGDYERSLDLYTDLFNKDSNNYTYFDAVKRMNIQLKRYSEAIQISYRRLRFTPFDFNLQANIGSLYTMAGMHGKADSIWNVILISSNKNQMVYRAVANEQTEQRLFDKAIATYVRGRNEIGDQYIFANELGYLYSFMMDYENFTREYLKLLKQNELQYEFVRSRISTIVAKNEGLRAAIKIVAEELAVTQSVPLLRLQLWLSMEDDRYQDAFVIIKKIEAVVGSNGTEIFQFGEQVFREKHFSVAADAYQLALTYTLPVQFIPQAKFGIARCAEEMSEDTNAHLTDAKEKVNVIVPTYLKAIELYSLLTKEYSSTNTSANALYRIGMIRYKRLYDLDGAIRIFDSIMTTSPAGQMTPIVLSTMGEVLLAQGKITESESKYSSIVRSSFANGEQRSSAQFCLAELQFFRNNFDSAVTLLRPLTQNLKADETNDALLLQYFITENQMQFIDALKLFAHAQLLARQMKISESINELDAIVDLYPTAPLADDALLRKGEYCIQLQNYGLALASYQKLLDEYKLSTEKDKTYFRIGELYQFYLNDKQKAIQSYEMILEKYPYSMLADEARKRIRMLRGDAI